MKTIYHSKQLVIGMIFISLLLFLSAWTEENLTYRAIYLSFGAVFLIFSLCAIRLPAVKIEDASIQVRQFFGFGFRTVSRTDLSSYEKIGKSRLSFYNSDGTLILKLGFFSEPDLNQILDSLKLKKRILGTGNT